MAEAYKFCRKCLTQEMTQEAYLEWLQAHIDSLDEDSRAAAGEYRRRLAVCEDCPRLTDGLCRACGCYVIFRCIGKKQVCPYGSW